MVALTERKPDTYAIDHHTIRCFHRVRVLLVDDVHEVKLTPTEYRAMLCLLEGRLVDDDQLAKVLFQNQLRLQETLNKHIDNIRRKLREADIDLSIRRVSMYGYVLASGGRKGKSHREKGAK